MRLVRSRAAEFGVRPDRIGAVRRVRRRPPRGVGGGASSMRPKAAPARRSMRVSARPDFRRAAVSGRDDEGAASRTPTRGATCSAHRRRRALIDRFSIEVARHARTCRRSSSSTRPKIERADREQPGCWSRALRERTGPASSRISTRRARTASASTRISAPRRSGRTRLAEWLAPWLGADQTSAAWRRRDGRAASKGSARPISATARSSIRSWPAIIPIRRS